MNSDEKRITEELQRVCKIHEKEAMPNTNFIQGCSKLKVEMLSGPDDWIYAAMVEGVLQTWGDHTSIKWDEMSPETRFFVLKEALEGRALPLVLEMPQFVFKISGVSRASFDQIARARIGAVFCAKGVRDNSARDWDVIVPTAIYEDDIMFDAFKQCWFNTKNTYCYFVNQGRESWQSARSVLGMNVEYSYIMGINYMALKNMCARRLINTEQEDTVGTAIGLWNSVNLAFPLLASYLKPIEDIKKKNLTIEVNGLSKHLGLLFGGSGSSQRWPLPDTKEFSEIRFNTAASDWEKIQQQMGIRFPSPDKWPQYNTISDLFHYDRERIMM